MVDPYRIFQCQQDGGHEHGVGTYFEVVLLMDDKVSLNNIRHHYEIDLLRVSLYHLVEAIEAREEAIFILDHVLLMVMG